MIRIDQNPFGGGFWEALHKAADAFINMATRHKYLPATAVVAAIIILSSSFAAGQDMGNDLTLWYQKPAGKVAINEGLPIGNGNLGALVTGGVEGERMVLNEDSLWTGDDNPSGQNKKFEGTMGDYQTLAELFIDFNAKGAFTAYRRDLSLAEAVASVSYKMGGVSYRREYFASHPAGAIIARFSADKPGSYSGSLSVRDWHNDQTTAEGNRITLRGSLSNNLSYEGQLVVLHEGGTLTAEGSLLRFSGCDSVTIVFAAGTNYAMNPAKGYRGEDPHPAITERVNKASAQNWESLKAAHIADYQKLFNRVALKLGTSSPEQINLPTDQRKVNAATDFDPGMVELLFQYGRYLLIGCSRPGSLPANLQGLWNDDNGKAWGSDYHNNINVQMNYWPAEVTNLGECHTPFFDLVVSQIPTWRKTTASEKRFSLASGVPPTGGWVLRIGHNSMGGMCGLWDKTANAWYCQHFWEHYAFGQDKEYLSQTAYPVMKEIAQFWDARLKELPGGALVVPMGWSPEHGPTEDGVSYNQQILWDLFNNIVEAANALGVDQEFRDHISKRRDQLLGPKIGSWGQLLEWKEEKMGDAKMDKKDGLVYDTPDDHHRHTSHLFALFPGRQINPEKTPDFAKAAKVSLDARGIDVKSDAREWSFAWRSALYARLKDGESANTMVTSMFTARNTCANLFGLCPPMQIDGNFGVTAGIAEMLIQSYAGEIELLPALPKDWRTGSFKGLRARGGYSVDCTWEQGKVTDFRLYAKEPKTVKVRVNGEVKSVQADLEK